MNDKEIKLHLMELAKDLLGPAATTATVIATAKAWWGQWFE